MHYPAVAPVVASPAFPPFRVVVFPSVDGSRFDFLALAPATLSVEEAKAIADAAIKAANAEDALSDEGVCADGLCVEESIVRRLAEQGFLFPVEAAGQLVKTALWDVQMD